MKTKEKDWLAFRDAYEKVRTGSKMENGKYFKTAIEYILFLEISACGSIGFDEAKKVFAEIIEDEAKLQKARRVNEMKEIEEPTARQLSAPHSNITEYSPVNIEWMVKHLDSYKERYENDLDSLPIFVQANNGDGTHALYEIRGTTKQKAAADDAIELHRLFNCAVADSENMYKNE